MERTTSPSEPTTNIFQLIFVPSKRLQAKENVSTDFYVLCISSCIANVPLRTSPGTATATTGIATDTSDDDAATDNKDDNNNKDMAPKTVTKVAKAPKTGASTKSGIDDITAGLSDVTVTSKARPYSVIVTDPYIMRLFHEETYQYIEVDVCFGAGSLPRGSVEGVLSPTGDALLLIRGLFSFFFQPKRLRKMLGTNYNRNSSHVMGQHTSSDLFNMKEKVLDGVIFGSNPQVIKLPLVCFGGVEQCAAVDNSTDIVCTHTDGSEHIQFVTTITFKMTTVSQFQKPKKAVPTTSLSYDINNDNDSEREQGMMVSSFLHRY